MANSTNGILLLGAGGHAISCIEVIEAGGKYCVVGLIGIEEEVGNTVDNYEVLGTDANIMDLAGTVKYAHISVGQIKSAALRMKLYQQAIRSGMSLPTLISPHAHVSGKAEIGAGSIVMAGAVVNAGVKIGDNCIINTSAVIDHGVMIGDFSHISTGVILNGDAEVGKESFVGSGTTVKENVKIGSSCVVGMGLAIKNNVPAGTLLRENC